MSEIVKEEMVKLRKSFDAELNALHVRVNAIEVPQESTEVTVSTVENKCNDLASKLDQRDSGELNIILFDVPHSTSENVKNNVDAILKDSMKLRDVTVEKVERKQNAKSSRPGIIVAKCKRKEDFIAILKSKSKLRQSAMYKKVMISVDKPKVQSDNERNIRVLASVLQDKISVKGYRLTKKNPGNEGRP